ncbi:MAG TPA: PKD domain-containing protein [Candidatus Thermoplasmatota archaeon]|nr:PKD domain-containing protein [Candidatus Thermoplasmatota archaeon]
MLLRVGLACIVILAVATAGCTGGVGRALKLNSASLENPTFELSPEKGEKDTTFHVDSNGLGDKYNVTWDWGDGTLTYGATSDHAYGFTNGVMTVTLVATDDGGTQGFATRTLTLGNGENKAPTVNVRAQRTWIEVGKTINLTATGSDGDRDPLTYFWSYASENAPAETAIDGATGRVPVSFDAPGKYDVKVRARDPKGGEAAANVTITVSTTIPSTRLDLTFNGTILLGTGGIGISEKPWILGPPVPDTNLDAVRHHYTLDYPAFTLIFLMWNDTSTQGAIDLDLELRASNGTTVFKSETRAPAAPFEFNTTQQPPGEYDIIVRGVVGAKVEYTVLLQSTLQITPDLVAAAGSR